MVFCSNCGRELQAGDRYCTGCGKQTGHADSTAAAPVERTPGRPARPRPPFQWKYVALSLIIFTILQVVAGFIIGGIIASKGLELEIEQASLPILFAAYASFFIGGLLVGRQSPGITIREPALGAALGVTLGSLVSKNWTIVGLVVGWILPYVLAFLGAMLGEKLQAGRARA